MKSLFAATLAILALLVLNSVMVSAEASVALAAAAPSCHNATGSCTKSHFVCANEELIPHHRRCDGVEDCADGTDEYMCDSEHFHPNKPVTDMSVAERTALTEVSCIKCTCSKGQISVLSTNTAWWKIAIVAPRDRTLMTNAPLKLNKPCNPAAATEIILNVYKKQNKGCRGWVCCFRQEWCKTCSGTQPTNNCWP